MAAHELKTPMTGPWARAQLLRRRLNTAGMLHPAQTRLALDAVSTRVQKLSRLLEQLAAISLVEAGRADSGDDGSPGGSSSRRR